MKKPHSSYPPLIETLLSKEEWMFFELKGIRKKPSELLESVIAFANSEWWYLILWIEDKKKAEWYDRLTGISPMPDNYAEFLRLVPQNIQPFLSIQPREVVFINPHTELEDKIIIVEVSKSNDIHSLTTGDTYIRTENGNKKIGSQEITRLKYEKWSISFEDQISKVDSLEDIDTELWTTYKRSINAKSQDDRQILKDNGLAIMDNWIRKLKFAWALLFLKNPSVQLWWKYGIKISHYYGNKPNFTGEPNFVRRPFSIEGPLLHQIESAIDYFRDIVRNAPPTLQWATFNSTILIPERAFQELITNAVIHRNYAIPNDIHIRIFDDHIEVESPWSYPGHITPANIQSERFARNPIILRTLNRFEQAPNLDIGEWVNRLFQIMKEHNLYDPYYIPPIKKPHSVEVILFNLQKIEYWDTVNKYLEDNTYITSWVAREITGINDRVDMSRLLKSRVNQWLLIQEWEKRYARYRKIAQNESLFSGPLIIEN